MKSGRKRSEAVAKVDRERLYALDDACKLVKDAAWAKFDESVDLAVRLGVETFAKAFGCVHRPRGEKSENFRRMPSAATHSQ